MPNRVHYSPALAQPQTARGRTIKRAKRRGIAASHYKQSLQLALPAFTSPLTTRYAADRYAASFLATLPPRDRQAPPTYDHYRPNDPAPVAVAAGAATPTVPPAGNQADQTILPPSDNPPSTEMTTKHTTFVGRQALLLTYFEEIRRFKQNRNTMFFQNIYAITGMGKTWLIYLLYLALQDNKECNVAWLSFAALDEPHALPAQPEWLPRVLGYLPIKQTATPPSPKRTKVAEACESILKQHQCHEDVSLISPQLATIEVAFAMSLIPSHLLDEHNPAKTVLFIDGVDLLERNANINAPEVWENLQQSLLRPLYLTGNVLCFITSQSELQWKYFDLARVAHAARLDQLTSAEIRMLSTAYGLHLIADNIYQLSQGHPDSATWLLQQEYRNLYATLPATTTAPPTLRSKKRAADTRQFNAYLEQLSPTARDLLPVAGLLRYVDVAALMDALQQAPLPALPVVDRAVVRAALDQYQALDLVTLTTEGPLRYLWQANLRLAIEAYSEKKLQPPYIITLQSVFTDWFYNKLQRAGWRQRLLLAEWLYHSVEVVAATPTTSVASQRARYTEWFIQLLQLWDYIGDDALAQTLLADAILQERLKRYQLDGAVRIITEYQKHIHAQAAEKYTHLLNYLLATRLPQVVVGSTAAQLSPKDLVLLGELAKPEGFNVNDLKQAMERLQAPMIAGKEISWSDTMEQLDRFTGAYVATYDVKLHQFKVDTWLGDFLHARVKQGDEA